MKTLAFALALSISAFGVAGVLVPSILVGIAQHSVTTGTFYVVAAVRVAFGLLLVSAAPTSRAPKTIRVAGYIIFLVGIITALTGVTAIGSASKVVGWWLQQGPGVVRFTSGVLVALGGSLAFACAPRRRQK